MSRNSPELEPLVREYLDHSKKEEEARSFGLLFQYLGYLYEDSEEEVSLEDFSAYEADDFLNFFLEDKFPDEYKSLRKESMEVLKNFIKYLSEKKMIPSEELKEWKEVLK
jgi:ClpP class serine protease